MTGENEQWSLEESAQDFVQASTCHPRTATPQGQVDCAKLYLGEAFAAGRASRDAEVAELRAKYDSERALTRKMSEEHGGERAWVLNLTGQLYEHLALMVQYLEEETSQGDGIADEHSDGYEAAKALLEHAKRNEPQWENASVAIHELQLQAADVPGLTATLDELRAQLAEKDAVIAKLQDRPECDATDGAHPAWWRGHDRAEAKLRELVAEKDAQLVRLLRAIANLRDELPRGPVQDRLSLMLPDQCTECHRYVGKCPACHREKPNAK